MEEWEASVEKLISGGRGLLRHPKLGVCFVPQVLPDEKVRFRVPEASPKNHASRNFFQAELLEVLEPSPGRVLPRCVHYNTCGGCDWQHIRYESQVKLKELIVRENLLRFAGQDYADRQLPALAEPDNLEENSQTRGWEYRQRAKFFWQPQSQNQEPYYGFSQRSGKQLLAVPHCQVIDPKIRRAITGLSEFCGTELHVFAPNSEAGCAFGDEEFEYHWNGLKLRSQAQLFFQSNSKVLPLLLDRLQSSLVPILQGWDGDFFDLYAGVGLFSLCLGDSFSGNRFAVERNTYSFKYLQENLAGKNFRCHREDVGSFLKQARLS
ncbi:MAG: hypothetical protein AAF975_09310, partial [Spirochaetota bacterium]